mgnify:CR=1 FL=1
MELYNIFLFLRFPLVALIVFLVLFSYIRQVRYIDVGELLTKFLQCGLVIGIIMSIPEVILKINEEIKVNTQVIIQDTDRSVLSLEEKIKKINEFRKKEGQNILLPKDEKIIEKFEKYAEEKGIKEKIGI